MRLEEKHLLTDFNIQDFMDALFRHAKWLRAVTSHDHAPIWVKTSAVTDQTPLKMLLLRLLEGLKYHSSNEPVFCTVLVG